MRQHRYLFLIGLAVSLIGSPRATWGQAVSNSAAEGYVFDRTTLHPIPKAVVFFTEHLADGTSDAQGTVTDANGFFSIELTPATNAVSFSVDVRCQTTRGTIYSTLPVYSPLRPIIYRRDLYLTFPKRKTACDG